MRGWWLLCLPVLAWGDTLGPWIGTYTYHLSRDEPVNERNHLVGVQYNHWFLARFDNSYGDPSWALGYALGRWSGPLFPGARHWRYRLRLSPGVAYGYGDRLSLSVGDWTPGLIPSAGVYRRLGAHWRAGADVLYIWTDDGGVLLQGLSLTRQW